MPLAYSRFMQTVVETPTYLKAATALFTETERAAIVAAIALDPEAGDLMPGDWGISQAAFWTRRNG